MEDVKKKFKDIPINAHFYQIEESGKIVGYRKSTYETGVENFTQSIKEFNLYDDVWIVIQPKFILNY